MAGLLGVQRSTYGEYERGRIRPPAEKLFELADYFGVCMGYLSGSSEGRGCPLARSGDVHEALVALRRMLADPGTPLAYRGAELTADERGLLAVALDGVAAMGDHVKGVGSDG